MPPLLRKKKRVSFKSNDVTATVLIVSKQRKPTQTAFTVSITAQGRGGGGGHSQNLRELRWVRLERRHQRASGQQEAKYPYWSRVAQMLPCGHRR